MAFRDLREFLSRLEAECQLLSIEQQVDARFEYCALLQELDRRRGPAVHVTNVSGASGTLAGNLLGTRQRLALGLECAEASIGDEYSRRKAELIPPVHVNEGPVLEVVAERDIDVLAALPIPIFHERDASPYLTAAVATARSPISGFQSTGIHRVQVKGPNRLGLNLATPPLSQFLAEAEQRGQRLPIALCIGLDPAMLFSSVVFRPGADRFAIAGAMRGQPVELLPARSVALDVLAQAEAVIEGEIVPGIREPEGPFGETSGYYCSGENCVMEVTAVTHRRRPIHHAVHPKSSEVFNLLIPGREADLREQLRAAGIGAVEVHATTESGGMEVAISVRKRSKSEARSALLRILSDNPFFKKATIVDDDVDVFDPRDVAWAVATRCQPDRDLLVLPGLPGSGIDPSAQSEPSGRAITAKLGVDATKAEGDPRFDRIAVPQSATEAAGALLRQLGEGSSSV